MSLKRWKLGLIVAIITGVFSGGVIAFIAPTATPKQIAFIILYNICQNALLFLKDHPVEKLEDVTTFIEKDKK